MSLEVLVSINAVLSSNILQPSIAICYLTFLLAYIIIKRERHRAEFYTCLSIMSNNKDRVTQLCESLNNLSRQTSLHKLMLCCDRKNAIMYANVIEHCIKEEKIHHEGKLISKQCCIFILINEKYIKRNNQFEISAKVNRFSGRLLHSRSNSFYYIEKKIN